MFNYKIIHSQYYNKEDVLLELNPSHCLKVLQKSFRQTTTTTTVLIIPLKTAYLCFALVVMVTVTT